MDQLQMILNESCSLSLSSIYYPSETQVVRFRMISKNLTTSAFDLKLRGKFISIKKFNMIESAQFQYLGKAVTLLEGNQFKNLIVSHIKNTHITRGKEAL